MCAGGKKMQEMSKFVFVGGQLFLDFLNTEVIQTGERVDLLGNPADLRAWLSAAGILETREARQAAASLREGKRGIALLAQAREIRRNLREIACGLMKRRKRLSALVGRINRLLRACPGHLRISPAPAGLRFELRVEPFHSIHLLSPVIFSAAGALMEGGSGRVKKCGNPACILLFYDTTKSRTRHWCSMAGCGNRMKIARFRRKRGRARRG